MKVFLINWNNNKNKKGKSVFVHVESSEELKE
jgi:hypothetical protein